MSDRAKLILGISVVVVAMIAAVISYQGSFSRAAPQPQDSPPVKAEVLEYLKSLHTEVQPTDENVHQVLDDFEHRVAETLRRDAPTTPQPDRFASAAKDVLRRILVGSNQASQSLTHLTSIGLEQMSARAVFNNNKSLIADEVDVEQFGRVTWQPSPGVIPERDKLAGPLIVELRVPMRLPADPPAFANRVVAPVGVRLAWDQENQTWVFWNYTIVHVPGHGILAPGL